MEAESKLIGGNMNRRTFLKFLSIIPFVSLISSKSFAAKKCCCDLERIEFVAYFENKILLFSKIPKSCFRRLIESSYIEASFMAEFIINNKTKIILKNRYGPPGIKACSCFYDKIHDLKMNGMCVKINQNIERKYELRRFIQK